MSQRRLRIGTNPDAEATPIEIDRLADRILGCCNELEANVCLLSLAAAMARIARAAGSDDDAVSKQLAQLALDTGFVYDKADGGGVYPVGPLR